jgi:hypothetical protein
VVVAVALVMSWIVRGRRARRLDPRLLEFRRDVEAACAARDESAAKALLRRPGELGLNEDEVALELEMLEGLLELQRFVGDVQRNGLPALDTRHRVLGQEVCHFSAPAFLADNADAGGKLFLTGGRAVFLSGGVTSVPWSSVVAARREQRDLVLVAPDRGAVFRFRCNTFADAMKGAFVAEGQVAARRARRNATRGDETPAGSST